mmetsp:Transcript_3981/g.8804  ORF Transcript_3981/g.8804 Transcript_3981/m.8804 type:complete len:319 (-) Transcript_3981:444-1400(-)
MPTSQQHRTELQRDFPLPEHHCHLSFPMRTKQPPSFSRSPRQFYRASRDKYPDRSASWQCVSSYYHYWTLLLPPYGESPPTRRPRSESRTICERKARRTSPPSPSPRRPADSPRRSWPATARSPGTPPPDRTREGGRRIREIRRSDFRSTRAPSPRRRRFSERAPRRPRCSMRLPRPSRRTMDPRRGGSSECSGWDAARDISSCRHPPHHCYRHHHPHYCYRYWPIPPWQRPRPPPPPSAAASTPSAGSDSAPRRWATIARAVSDGRRDWTPCSARGSARAIAPTVPIAMSPLPPPRPPPPLRSFDNIAIGSRPRGPM